MSKVHVELRSGVAHAYLDHRPLRPGDRVHVSRRHRPRDLPNDVVHVRFVRAHWSSVEVESEDGRRHTLKLGEAYFVRDG